MSGFGKVMPGVPVMPKWIFNKACPKGQMHLLWCDQSAATTGGSIYYSDTVNYTTAGTGNVWYQWNQRLADVQTVSVTTPSPDIWPVWNIVVHESQVERDRRAEAYREQARQRNEALRVANTNAERLLLAHLTPQQRDQYKEHQWFEVYTARGARIRRYRIAHGYAGNVTVFNEEGKAIERLCIHCDSSYPVADNLLAQKLLLEADEEKFLKTANHTRLAA